MSQALSQSTKMSASPKSVVPRSAGIKVVPSVPNAEDEALSRAQMMAYMRDCEVYNRLAQKRKELEQRFPQLREQQSIISTGKDASSPHQDASIGSHDLFIPYDDMDDFFELDL